MAAAERQVPLPLPLPQALQQQQQVDSEPFRRVAFFFTKVVHLHARCVNEVYSTGRSGHSYNVPLCVKGRLLGHSFLTGNHFCWYQLQYR